jgi:hypothetical protein
MLESDKQLYEPVGDWLLRYLSERHRGSRVLVRECHRTPLSSVIRRLGLAERFLHSDLWHIKVDLVGIVLGRRLAKIVLVECKAGQPTLMDVCQVLGYCLVVKPVAALLLSPAPISDGLAQLLRVHGRYDILEYERHRRLRIATWNPARGEMDHASILPPGEHL